MRVALLLMLVPLVVMLALIGHARRFAELWTATLGQAQGLLPILLLAVLFAACVEVLVPTEAIGRWLGASSGWRGICVAWLAGVVTPGGGPIGLTLVAAFVRQGASVPVVLTYLVSLATLSLIRMPLEVAILGGRLSFLRVAFCLVLPPLVGGAARLLRL